jgi:hypothetical protein
MMTREERAKQFQPFDAMKGLQLLCVTGRRGTAASSGTTSRRDEDAEFRRYSEAEKADGVVLNAIVHPMTSHKRRGDRGEHSLQVSEAGR